MTLNFHISNKFAFSLLLMLFSCSFYSNSSQTINAIVNIEFNKVVPWDDGYNKSGVGTGFVIDAEKGLILTNKHIVNVAPIVAYAEFSNKKLVPLVPIYRDPIHDFGVFQYDVTQVDDLAIEAIELVNEASIGEAVTLYGNDGGESLSIINGVLSRLDRGAPNYNSPSTDYNTFYMQAALGTSGGSSGSPILNSKNQAIALNAGARRDTATSFFLPMDMIIPTISRLRNGESIKRGSLQTVFGFETFNQLRKKGWDNARIQQALNATPDGNGRLEVKHIVQQSPASSTLKIGDILLKINKQIIGDFLSLKTLLDASVGKELPIAIERDGKVINTKLIVSDLFKLVPNEYITYANAYIMPVSISIARTFNVPVEGVMVTSPGKLFGSQNINRFAIIDEINNTKITSLTQFKSLLSKFTTLEKFSLRYRYAYDKNTQRFKTITNYSSFFTNRHCQDNLGKLLWHCEDIPNNNMSPDILTKISFNKQISVSSPIVEVEVFRPISVNLSNDVKLLGHGVIVDIDEGLIITDKSLIDSSLSRAMITLNNGITIPSEVVAKHPYLNMVIIRADLSNFNFTNDSIVTLIPFDFKNIKTATLVSNSAFQDFRQPVDVGRTELSGGEMSFDSRYFSQIPDNFSIFVDDKNNLLAIAPAYNEKRDDYSAIPLALIQPFIEKITKNEKGLFEVKDKLEYISYRKAIESGLSGEWAESVSRKIAISEASELENSGLKSGDIILKINNEKVEHLNQIFNAVAENKTDFLILRNGKTQSLDLSPKFTSFLELDSVLLWAGAIIQDETLNVQTPLGISSNCVRIGIRYFGAPIYAAMGQGSYCVFSVDGKLIENLEQLKQIAFNKSSGDFTTIQVIDIEKNYQLLEFRLIEENYYWSTRYFNRTGNTWDMELLKK
ncbi:trypsin-like peptidase domain-containing protein [Glaciecola petra]|uniref:Trypsin-like peptidase domain-containing protein n=1 Tax=Glaciecola petra TaxID=3075602 RepID=A0ABU2ZTM4_9ALTE|nr:trypsin-like peptidase domain-containing protein [Aestuariibacter sp. P117]MDT0595760.1 trypsin-like peptidase domain-containing protein [Aestuariibacter sp. P117]